jgi:hypothetical protein
LASMGGDGSPWRILCEGAPCQSARTKRPPRGHPAQFSPTQMRPGVYLSACAPSGNSQGGHRRSSVGTEGLLGATKKRWWRAWPAMSEEAPTHIGPEGQRTGSSEAGSFKRWSGAANASFLMLMCHWVAESGRTNPTCSLSPSGPRLSPPQLTGPRVSLLEAEFSPHMQLLCTCR